MYTKSQITQWESISSTHIYCLNTSAGFNLVLCEVLSELFFDQRSFVLITVSATHN
jgi:hypothetical protein